MGFKFGRKLADWGQDEPGSKDSEGKPQAGIRNEDEEIQKAIALSLHDLNGKGFQPNVSCQPGLWNEQHKA